MRMVLLGSRKPGYTSWAITRLSKKARISGMMEGDIVAISFRLSDGERIVQQYTADGIISIPPNCDAIRVEHTETSGNRVSVDLL